MCLRLVKYCWTSLGLLLEERSHGIDCLLREQSIFERTKTCVQITIRNAAPTKKCAYMKFTFAAKQFQQKKIFLSLFENATILAFLSTFYWCRRLCGPRSAVVFPGKEEIVFFLVLTYVCINQCHINSSINLFVSKLLSNLKIVPISWIFFHQSRPSRQPSQ